MWFNSPHNYIQPNRNLKLMIPIKELDQTRQMLLMVAQQIMCLASFPFFCLSLLFSYFITYNTYQ